MKEKDKRRFSPWFKPKWDVAPFCVCSVVLVLDVGSTGYAGIKVKSHTAGGGDLWVDFFV